MSERDDMPALPETPYQLYYEWPDDEDGYGGSEVVDGDAYTADQMHAYARAYAEQRVRAQSLADEELMREAQEVLFCVNVIEGLDEYENLAGEKLAPKVGNILRRLLNRLGE